VSQGRIGGRGKEKEVARRERAKGASRGARGAVVVGRDDLDERRGERRGHGGMSQVRGTSKRKAGAGTRSVDRRDRGLGHRVEQLGQLEVVAGVRGEDLDAALGQIQLNCMSLVSLTGRLLSAMVARGRGGVINVASSAAFQPIPTMAV